MPATCDKCGKETKVEEAYYKIQHWSTSEVRRRCPECWLKLRKRGFSNLILAYLGVSLAGVALALTGNYFGWFLVSMVMFYLFLILATLPHELGHAFAAKAVGFRSFCAVIGFGRVVFERPFCGFTFQLRSIPLGGFAYSAPKDTAHYKLKRCLTIFAGPFANLVLAAMLVVLFPNATLNFDFTTGVKPANIFFLANVYVFFFNLWPRVTHTALGELPTDGLYIWKTIFLRTEKIEKMPLAYFLYEGNEKFRQGCLEQASKFYEEGLKRFPGDVNLLNMRGTYYIYSKQASKAREVFRVLLEQPSINWHQRGLYANNLAYVNALIGGDELLREADKYSQEALESLPTYAPFKGTRGFVLVEMDRIEEGIGLLKEAMEQADEPRSKALDACHLAMAEKRRGNFEESRKFAEIARSADPNCMLLDRLA